MTPSAPQSERINRIVEEYAQRRRAGEPIDLYEFLRLYPGDEADLAGPLEVVEDLLQAARPLTQPTTGALPPGTLFGPYRIEKALGQGASAIVYQALDTSRQRQVALKVFHPGIAASVEARTRFRRDGQIAARLDHPNIVRLHEAGEHNGLLYSDMALIQGETLEVHLTRHSGAVGGFAAVAEIVRKLADALDHAHRQGVVHRDVKPSNILIESGSGEPMLTDFGLARHVDATHT
jgi:serine/threonine protein kinase